MQANFFVNKQVNKLQSIILQIYDITGVKYLEFYPCFLCYNPKSVEMKFAYH